MPVHEEPSTPRFKAYILVEIDFSYDQFKNLRHPNAVATDYAEYVSSNLDDIRVEFPEIKSVKVELDEVF